MGEKLNAEAKKGGSSTQSYFVTHIEGTRLESDLRPDLECQDEEHIPWEPLEAFEQEMI